MQEAIAQAALRHLGTPFVLGRRDVGRALDCVGLILVVARELQLPVLEPPAYSLRQMLRSTAQETAIQCGLTQKHELVLSSDVVLLEMITGRPFHFGIVCGDLVVHACDRRKRVVSDPFTNCFDSRVRGVFTWPKPF